MCQGTARKRTSVNKMGLPLGLARSSPTKILAPIVQVKCP